MNIPADLKYTTDHEWIKLEGSTAVIGITDYAQGELGDIVYVELPGVDDEVEKGEAFGTIEAVKAVADLFCPLSGKVLEINAELEDEPETINNDAYGEGWMIKIELSDESELEDMMDAAAYEAHVS